MDHLSHEQLLNQIPPRLAELLGAPVNEFNVKREPKIRGENTDLAISWGNHHFIVECKSSGHAAAVAIATQQVKNFAKALPRKAVPLVAVPYMGEVGQKICKEAGVGWLDLSGNADFVLKGLPVRIKGEPNRFKRVGRPRSLFAPKSARIARWLLMKRDQAFAQRELARISGLDEGFTSRIVRGLEEERLVTRDASGAVKAADFDAMLDAWHEDYDFSKHHIVRGHVPARSSDDLLGQLVAQLKRKDFEHAATGLAGAWQLDHFAGFRLVVCYVAQFPSAEVRKELGFREESRGENLWLVVPNDEGVFHGATESGGIRCVHPVQVYLDLKNHPERASEAAEHLRRTHLSKGRHV